MLGIYEVSYKKISFETGIDKNKIEAAFISFQKADKISYNGSYVIIKNFLKHQNFNTNMKKSAIEVYNNLPNGILSNRINIDKTNPLKGFETLCNHLGMVWKEEYEYEREYEVEEEKNIIIQQKKFIDLEYEFKQECWQAGKNDYSEEMIKNFFNYWSEKDKKGKMRYQKETTWEIKKRLATWNSKSFNKTTEKKSSFQHNLAEIEKTLKMINSEIPN